MYETAEKKERVILVGVSLADSDDAEQSLNELEELADTAGALCVGRILQKREQMHPATYLGRGKTEELKDLKKRILPVMKHECGKNGVSMVFFMLTNILEESSEILCYGDGSGRLVEESFEVKEKNGGYMLPGVVSRKKQLIPAFIGTLQQNNS